MKESYLMLMLLIPGPTSPGKDINVYLRPLINDLKDLWALKGVDTIDVATGQTFNMRAMLLWTINDFPARSSLSGWSGQGYMACPICNEDTPSMRVLSKTAYVGHIRFLKKPHKWRRSLNFNGETKDRDPPRKFIRAQILTQLDRLPTREKGNIQVMGVPEIDTYQAKFKSEFPNQDMKEEFRDWFGSHIRQRYIDKDPGVSATGELFALACGPTSSLISTDISKITRKQSKSSKHGHENLKSTKRSQRIKAEARNVKPQSNPIKGEISQIKALSIPLSSSCHVAMVKAQ
ncbi:hypothetical protein Tco_1152931 [Tanacetum coccineum]